MGNEKTDGEVPAEGQEAEAAPDKVIEEVTEPQEPAAEQASAEQGTEGASGSDAAPDETGADSHASGAEDPFADMAASGAGMAMAGAAETAAPVADAKRRSGKSGRKAKNSAADEGMPNADGTVSTHVKKHHRKRNIIILVALLLVLAIVGTTLGVMFTGSPDPIEDLGFATVSYELPTDGSTPMDHTGVENIGYMNYKLHSQPYYYAEMHGTVSTIMTQNITTYKQYYNNVLISSDITTSSMINSAVQFCTTDDRVIWREAAGGASTYKGLDTEYKTGTPLGSCTISEYKVLRGFPPSEFSVYVLNEDTIDSWSDVTDNGDGTYTQTFYLHVANEPYENSAVYYYKQQMVATGGLTDFPTFTSSQITYTFDDEWQVLDAVVSEAYKATMGISVDCTSDSETVYTYGNEELCKNSAYEDYFEQYEDVDIAPEDDTISATNCLAQAFGSVLTEPVVFSLDMSIDGQPMTGLLYLDINNMDIRADLGNLGLYIEEPDDDSMWLYLSYGDDTKVKLDINSLDFSAFSSGSGGLSLDTDELLSELSGGEFTVSADGSKATLYSELNLLGLTVPVSFVFNIDSSGNISLGDVSTSLSLLGMNLDISIQFSSKNVPALTSAEKDEYMDIDDNADALINLIATITSTETEFSLEYETETFSLSAMVQLDLANSLAHGEIWVDFGNDTSRKYIGVDYKDGNLYLTLDSEDMDALKVKANLDDAIDLISSFLSSSTDDSGIATVSADDATEASSSIADIISSFANISLGDVVYKLLADNTFANTFHITENGQFEVQATELLECLGVNLDLGTLYLVADDTGVFLEDGPFDFSLTQGGEFTVNEEYYVEAEDLVTLISELETLIENKSVGLTGTVDVVIGEGEDATTIEVEIKNLTVDWSGGVSVYLDLGFYLNGNYQDICVLYTGSTNTLQLAYGTVGLELSFDTGEGSALANMESALVAAYDKIAEIANYYLTDDKQWDTECQTLQDILEGFGVAIEATEDSTDLISEILDLFSGIDTDSLDIMSLLGDMSFGQGKSGGFEVKIGGLDLEITDVSSSHEDEFTMDINLSYTGNNFEVDLEQWEVSAGSLGTISGDVQYVTADDIITLIDSLTATADILTGTTEIYVTYEYEDVAVTADILFSLQDSNASGTITAVFYTDDSTTKTVEFGYTDGVFYLSLYSYGNDPFLVKADVSDAVTIITGFFSTDDPDGDEETTDIMSTLLSTVSSLVSGETFSSVITKVFGEGEFFDIFSTNSDTGTVTVDIAAICALFNSESSISNSKADFSMGQDGITLDLDEAYGLCMTISKASKSVSINTGDYADAEDLVTLLENIEPILDDMAVSLTGSIELNISGTEVYLYIYDSRIDWSDGVSVYVYAALGIGDTYQDIYINYVGSTKTLQFAYGDVGAQLSFASGSDDVDTLEDALVDVYNRIVAVINSLVESANINTAKSLDDILSLFGTGSDLTELLGELFSSDDMNMSTDDIISMISSATFGVGDNGSLAIGIGDYLTLEILDASTTADGLVLVVNLSYSSETFSITLDGITLKAATGTYEMPEVVSYLDADSFASMLDFVAAGIEVIGEKEMTITISGTQYSYTSEYASYFYEKYNYTGTIAIDWGDSVYPITTDENGTIYVDKDLYMYIGLEFNANSSSDTSYTMSLYVLDRDMNGDTDGLLDLYLSISRKKSTDSDYDPLMIYIPAKDVMSMVSMAGALFDLDDLTSTSSIMQSVLTYVANFVDSALIDTYIPDTQDQFRSLGSSLISQFIDGGLQGLIDSLVDSVNDVVENITGGSDIDAAEQERTRSDAYIKSIDVSGTEFKLTVNSEAVYGSQAKDEDLVFKATKDADGNFTGMSIDNVYYNDMSDMLTMEMKIDRSVTRNTSFSGYTDFSGLDTLLQTLVNSATHETETTDSGHANNGEATEEEYEEAVAKYDLNSNYFISGIKDNSTGLYLKLYIWITSITLETINIDAISINIDENNKISLDAQIRYSSFVGVISDSATVNLSIRNDMIYMRKTVSGVNEYRIMSLSDFGSDIMDQIVWIFSFTDTIADMMTGDSDSSSTDMSSYDYGALVDAYLSSYTYTADDTSASWTFVINGDTIGDLAGISMTDITVTLNASKDAEDSVYTLSGLSLSGRLYTFIEFDLLLTYDNPQNTGSMADQVDTLYDVDIYDELTWDDILGGTTFDEITENINWDKILSDLGTTYLDYTGSGDLRVGQVEYYFEDENGTSTYLGGGDYILYNASTGTIYTTLNAPDISGYDKTDENLKAVWTKYDYDKDNNIVTITATRENTYSVTINGYDINDSTLSQTTEHVYASMNLEKDTLAYNGNNGYYYRLEYYTDENGDRITETGIDDDGNECYVLYVNADRAVTAHWERVYEVKFYCEDGSLISEYYYAGTTLTADNMPAVPDKTGYTGTWNTKKDGTGISSYDVAASSSGNPNLYAVYTINTYTITFTSDLEIDSSDYTYEFNENTGLYEFSIILDYGTTFNLDNAVPVSQFATVSGWTYGGITFAAGSTVTVGDDMTFTLAYSYKTITVHYFVEDAENESAKATIGIDGNYDLAVPTISGYVIYGLYYDNDGVWTEITNVGEFVLAGETSLNVYALASTEIGVEVTTASVSGSYISHKYTASVTATDIEFVGKFAGGTYTLTSASIGYYINNDANLDGRDNNLTTTTDTSFISSDSISKSKSLSESKDYIVVVYTIEFTYTTLDGSITISTSTENAQAVYIGS